VSIVTPTLNRAALLEFTLRSVRSQSYANLEHIVVDGGSTDGSLELLAQYERTYRLQWTSGPDSGMYAAINKGLATARGDILAYLNSDDLYFPWTLEEVVGAFEAHPTVDFVIGDALNIEQASGRIRVRWQAPFDLDTVRRVSFLTQPAVFWRRRVLEQVGPFDESLRYVADCDYWMRAGTTHRFLKIDEFLAIERDHAATLRESSSHAVDAELATVRERYVSTTGAMHRVRSAFDLARLVLWRRWLWLRFTARAAARPRSGPWARLLSTGRINVRFGRALLQQLPGAGRPLRDRVLRPDRSWLEPEA
jgi:glycosyltransferase involved in cell wall biosynthesis